MKNEDVLDDEETEITTGYAYTHFDCPYCGYDHQEEGDVKSEEFECDDCHRKFRVM